MLVAELKASSRKGESPKEKSPGRKEPALERTSQELPSSSQVVAVAAVPSSISARAKQTYPYCALPRYGPESNPHLTWGHLAPSHQGPLETGPGSVLEDAAYSAPSVGGDLGPLAGVEVGDSLFLTKHTMVP